MFTIDFFREDDGSKPVGSFIRSLDVKMKAKVVSDLHRLEMLGREAREPLSKHLEDDIFELRSEVGNNTARILYFFDEGRLIIATNAFVKKTQKTPKNEIALAKEREKRYFARKDKNNE